MGWHDVDKVEPPIGRPLLVRTVEADEPVIAFLSPERIWYAGGALVQSSTTLLSGTPVQWCEPQGDDIL
jgi:hypothetical protein